MDGVLDGTYRPQKIRKIDKNMIHIKFLCLYFVKGDTPLTRCLLHEDRGPERSNPLRLFAEQRVLLAVSSLLIDCV